MAFAVAKTLSEQRHRRPSSHAHDLPTASSSSSSSDTTSSSNVPLQWIPPVFIRASTALSCVPPITDASHQLPSGQLAMARAAWIATLEKQQQLRDALPQLDQIPSQIPVMTLLKEAGRVDLPFLGTVMARVFALHQSYLSRCCISYRLVVDQLS